MMASTETFAHSHVPSWFSGGGQSKKEYATVEQYQSEEA
jgi:hypothetical protein